jgi:hypothetical protein
MVNAIHNYQPRCCARTLRLDQSIHRCTAINPLCDELFELGRMFSSSVSRAGYLSDSSQEPIQTLSLKVWGISVLWTTAKVPDNITFVEVEPTKDI